jgi:hypothetical protein
MATRFNFSNLPFKFSPVCQRYLYGVLHSQFDDLPYIEVKMYPRHFFERSEYGFLLLFRRINKDELELSTICIVSPNKDGIEVTALATNLLSGKPQLDIFYCIANFTLAELLEWFQIDVINDFKRHGLTPDPATGYTLRKAFDDIMFNWQYYFLGERILS